MLQLIQRQSLLAGHTQTCMTMRFTVYVHFTLYLLILKRNCNWHCKYPAVYERKFYQQVYLWSFPWILWQHDHCVIRLSHLVIARRLLKLVLSLISLPQPTSITLFQMSCWSTSGQKSFVYFLFLFTANFWWEIESHAEGQAGNWAK